VRNALLFDSLAQAQQIQEGRRIEYNTAYSHKPSPARRRHWRICRGRLTRRSLILNCLLYGGVHAGAET
jgi:hypothetical protein